MINIRKFKKGDEKELSDLSRSCIVTLNSKDVETKEADILFEYFSPERFIEEAKRNMVFVAEIDGKIAGTATLDGELIRAVFVSPLMHGKGAGSTMMKCLEGVAKESGLSKVMLKSSPYAVKFYVKLGYKIIKEIQSEVGRLTLMEKEM